MNLETISETLRSFFISKDVTVKQAMRQIGESTGRILYLVDDGNKLVGSLSDGDVRQWILNEGSLAGRVDQACNQKPTFVREDYDIEEAKSMMLAQKIESIPVVNGSNEVVKILLWDDVFSEKDVRIKEQLNAQIVIMAGGKGERLDPFTKILPKPLIPIDGKPVIEIIMDRFSECGVNEFHLCLNHKSRMVKSYFQDTGTDWKIHYTFEQEPLGTAGGLKLIAEQLKDPFVVTNCDIIIKADYGEIVQFHKESENDLTLVVSCCHYVIPYGVCEIKSGGALKSMTEKPEQDLLVLTGMYVMGETMLNMIPDDKPIHMNELIKNALDQKCKVGTFPIREDAWIDIGQWEEYHKAVEVLRTR